MATFQKLKPILVEWMDIVDGGGEWQTDTPSPVKVRTIGYLYKQTKKHIVVIRDYHDMDGHRTIGGTLAIPNGCIHRVVNLVPKNEP